MSSFECPECGDRFEKRRVMYTHLSNGHDVEMADHSPWRDAELLKRLYHGEQKTIVEVADKLDCADSTVKKWMQKHGIETRTLSETWELVGHPSAGPRKDRPSELDDISFLERHYEEGEKSATQIAKELGCSHTAVTNALKRHGFEMRERTFYQKGPNPSQSDYPELYNESWVEEQYIEEKHTLEEIAEELGCTATAVMNALKRFGIETRGRGDYATRDQEGIHYGENWRQKRQEVLRRDGEQCSKCGISADEHKNKFNEGLHVHHIKPLREFMSDGEIDHESANDTKNLITFCRECHRKYEGVPIQNAAAD